MAVMVEEAPVDKINWLDDSSWKMVAPATPIVFTVEFMANSDASRANYHDVFRTDGKIKRTTAEVITSSADGVKGATKHVLETGATHVIVVRFTDNAPPAIISVICRSNISVTQKIEILRRIANELS